MSGETVDIILRLQGERIVAAGLDRVARKERELGDAGETAGKKHRLLNAELGVTSSIMKLFKPTAFITGIGLATQAVSALTSSAVALVGALSPAVGVLGAIPGLALAMGQGLGVARLAVSGLKDAVGGLNEGLNLKKLAALTPQAQRLAVQLDALKQPIIALQLLAQDGLFPALTAASVAAQGGLKALQPIVSGTSKVLGVLVARTTDLVRGWRKDLPGVGANNTKVIGALGLAGVALAGALWNIIVVTQPLVLWLSRSTQLWAQHLQLMSANGRASGATARFFEQVRHTLELISGLLKPFGKGLVNVFAGSLPTGEKLLGLLTGQAQAFAAWSSSLSGQSAIKKWFAAGLPTMVEMGRILRLLVHGFLQMGNGKQVTQLLTSLRRDLLPALGHLVDTSTKTFGPAFISALTSVVSLFTTLAGSSGAPLVVAANVIGSIAGGIDWLLKRFPMLTTLIGYTVVALAAIGTGASIIDGLLGFIGKVTKAFKLLKSACIGTRIELAGLWVQEKLVLLWSKLLAVGSGIAAAAQWLWNAALAAGAVAMEILMSPVTLVILGIAAMVLVVILVVKHWGYFHEKIMQVWGWVKANWPLILAILTGPVGLAVLYIVRHFDSIVGFFKGIGGRIAAVSVGMFDGIRDAFKSALNWIIRAWDRLHFKLPSFSFAGHKVGGFTLSAGHIPQLATGGIVAHGLGSWITGEAGPELNSFDGARVRVQPLTQGSPGPQSHGIVGALQQAAVNGDRTIQLVVDGRVLAQVVDDKAGDRAARR
jgi:hypothetical protein